MENTDQILDAPQVETFQLEYAGFWIRVLAYIVDSVILYGVGFVLGFAMGEIGTQTIAGIINLLLAVGYFGFMEGSEYQATLGKMAVGIKVGDKNGNQISVLNAIGRYLGKIVSALLLGIGFLMVAWDDRNQGIHDKLADTYVFYRK